MLRPSPEKCKADYLIRRNLNTAVFEFNVVYPSSQNRIGIFMNIMRGCLNLCLILLAIIFALLLWPKHQLTSDEIKSGVQCFSGFNDTYRPLEDHVRQSLRDSDSFELANTTITPLNMHGLHVVRMTYRAINGFGEKNVDTAAATVDKDCNMVEVLTD